MRLPTDNGKAIILVSQKIHNALVITINSHKLHTCIDSSTINRDLISANFYYLHNIPIQDMDTKHAGTAIKGSRAIITKKATVELNIWGHKISRTFYVSNFTKWNAILAQPFLSILHVMIDVRNHKYSIQATGKPRPYLYILHKQSHALSTAACSIYNCDNHITNHSSSHAFESDTDDKKAEFGWHQNESAAYIQSCIYCAHESKLVSSDSAEVTWNQAKIFTEVAYHSNKHSSNGNE